jgi:hypothetical protein
MKWHRLAPCQRPCDGAGSCYVRMNIVTPLEIIVVQLRKWDRKGCLKNRPRPDLQTNSGGAKLTVVEVETRHGKTCLFESDAMQIVSGTAVEGSLAYSDISKAICMAKETSEKLRLKTTPEFDRLIVERFDGTSLVIEGLGQAVFPLLRAFGWIAQ